MSSIRIQSTRRAAACPTLGFASSRIAALAAEGTAYDCVLVGGGLQNGLLALAILAERPDARIALVERADHLGGNHTWCFHAGDLPPSATQFVGPLVEQRWPGYEVSFPGNRRTIESP